MLRQTVHRLDLAARWLARPGGERRLTNVLHLAELLQAASTQARGEQALVRWLAHQIAGLGEQGEERVVRLESDADLVQVVTVHKSKGLEYPVVVMPFAATARVEKGRDAVLDLVDDEGRREVVLDPSAQALEKADLERLREDLRLMYVALTRARHALWLGVSAVTDGRATQQCGLYRSALGHLLAATSDTPPEGIAGLLQPWVRDDTVVLRRVQGDAACTAWRPPAVAVARLEAPRYAARFERDWAIGSFSSLVRDLEDTRRAQAVVPASARQEDLLAGTDPADALPAQGARAAAEPDAAGEPWHRFPRGALPGNFLHEQLEWLAGERFALNTTAPLQEALRRRCERQGWAHAADDVVRWLGVVAATPLPPLGVPLQALRPGLPEMEFWLPSAGLASTEVDRLCRAHLWPGQARPALPARQLHGMLMGFADLVFEHQGRYWVLDHKSNSLGVRDADYHGAALAGAMLAHRYDVQGSLYLLALHRLLRSRLGDAYRPDHHLGGAIFLFLRGVAGPGAGCCLIEPLPALLDGLDQALRTPGEAQGGEVMP